MTCEQVIREEIAERYLRGELPPDVQENYEQHYLTCSRCLEELDFHRRLVPQLLAQRQSILHPPVTRNRSFRKWAYPLAALATLVILVAAGVLLPLRMGSRPESEMPVTQAPPVAERLPDNSQALAVLGRFEPPPYEEIRLRSSDSDHGAFSAAMKKYQGRDFVSAASQLRKALATDPGSSNVLFYLGISELLSQDTKMGIAHLQQCLATKDPLFEEEAHFYIAKGYLAEGKIQLARNHLADVIRKNGELKTSAAELSRQIEKLD